MSFPDRPSPGEQAVQIVIALAPDPVEHPTDATSLTDDLGYDSLRLMELTIALEEHFDVRADSEETAGVVTLGDVAILVDRLTAS